MQQTHTAGGDVGASGVSPAGGAEEHGNELVPGRDPQQVRRLEVLHEVSRLHGSRLGNRTGHQVADEVAGRHARERQLQELGDRADRVQVRLAQRPHRQHRHGRS